MGLLSDLLKDLPTVGVARERIALAEEKYAALEAENAALKTELAGLKQELAALRQQLPSQEFVEHRGALFKRKADGRFEPVAYCPDCKRALNSLEGFMPQRCSKCKYLAPFTGDELPKVLAELAAS